MDLTTQAELVSDILPVVPVKNTVLFPHVFVPLLIGRDKSVQAVEAALATEDKSILIFTQRKAYEQDPDKGGLFAVGVKAVIRKASKANDTINIVVQGMERVRMLNLVGTAPFLKASVAAFPLTGESGPEVDALQRAILDQARRISKYVELPSSPDMVSLLTAIEDPLQRVYTMVSFLNLDVKKEQTILEAPTRTEALRLVHSYLEYELQVLELRGKIANDAASAMSEEHRKYLLRQQLKAIRDELGEKGEQADIELVREKLEKAQLPEAAKQEAERELKRLERMPDAAAEYQVIRSYLELVAELPWNSSTTDNLDLNNAKEILDADHYDLKDVKERILEHLAVLKLNASAKAPILCFVGPPGVGKTSLGQSVARALGRKFERQSLGGLHDEAELRGHRRTYVGAMPGRIIHAIRRAKSKNPVLMLDEIDKLGRDFRGDPSAALMEILDPAQNHEFRDNYLDLPFDLSQVFFIVTANSLDTIPKPLLDRMEVLKLAGYTDEEKLQIARKYLLPRRLGEAGVSPDQVEIPDSTVIAIIRSYTREAGLRELERSLGKIVRKIAHRIAVGTTEKVVVDEASLSEFLGPEHFFMEKARKKIIPGVVTGLAWTEAGGDVLYVEVIKTSNKDELTLTGQLGDVMKESARIALSFVASQADYLGIDQEVFRQTSIHVHVPAGAVPKDGPSAGVTMATALASVFTGKPVESDLAMTGEITLAGLVLPVGGIKEKLLAAYRSGIKKVILPKDNQKDVPEVPETVLNATKLYFVDSVLDVWKAAIPGLNGSSSSSLAAVS